MTTASKGLSKALARAGSSVVAIAEMQATDLLAEMTDEQKVALAAELAPAAVPASGAADSETAADANAGGEQQQSEQEEQQQAEASGAASSSERDRVKAVAAAVATDDTCKGKADLALAMLADDDYAGLSAGGIVKLLGKQSAPAAGADDTDAAARAEMQAALAETANSGIDAGGNAPNKGGAAASASLWDQAIAANNPGSRKPA